MIDKTVNLILLHLFCFRGFGATRHSTLRFSTDLRAFTFANQLKATVHSRTQQARPCLVFPTLNVIIWRIANTHNNNPRTIHI